MEEIDITNSKISFQYNNMQNTSVLGEYMASAEIIAIGSELLLGETQDTNTLFLLCKLRDCGINVFRTTMIGDNVNRISNAIQEALTRSDIVITTGGLGPTVDDPTREAVALSFGCNLIFDKQLWENIHEYFRKMQRNPTENNKRQAYLPEIAEPILNPVGTAPAFYIHQNNKLLISLPGVPLEMKYLTEETVIPLLKKFYSENEVILVRTLHSYGLGESVIDELVSDLEKASNPTLGLSAKFGQIDLRITAKGNTFLETKKLISDFESQIRRRLGINIFGSDDETLALVTNRMLYEKGIQLETLEINTNGCLSAAIEPKNLFSQTIKSEDPDSLTSDDIFMKHIAETGYPYSIALINRKDKMQNQIHSKIYFKMNTNIYHKERFYNSLTFSDEQPVLLAMELIRETILNEANTETEMN
jgi:nicotinamide-nucleotide amidase